MISESNPKTTNDQGLIIDHKFIPKAQWWSLCKKCNLAESAHKETELWKYYDDDTET